MPPVPDLIKLVFASGPAHLNRALIDRAASIDPEIPLGVIAEFEPHRGRWIPYHFLRSPEDNIASVRAALGDKQIHSSAMVFSSAVPVAKMRALARAIAPNTVAFDDSLRPVTFASHLLRRAAQAVTSPRTKKWLRTLTRPSDAEIPVRARLAELRGRQPRALQPARVIHQIPDLPEGVTVVIPSRDGKELLEVLLISLLPQLKEGEVIVSDNGSTDGTAAWLAAAHPAIRVIESPAPLSFAKAVNAGIQIARFHRILLINNDMVVQSGFITALSAAFDQVPQLFCATAQIFFPPGIRREETGKAVWRKENPLDFPVRCDIPLPGEDLTWVLYGSGGCSLFDTAKLLALGGVSEVYEPAYVEDMDFGFAAWKHGWPSVFCATAQVEHRHRATTARFYTPRQLDAFVEINYLRFLTQTISDPALFRTLWSQAIRRLQLMGAIDTLRQVPRIGPQPPPATGILSETEILALCNGDIAVFPGQAELNSPSVVIASPYLPWPLSHGGAVRMYNLMRDSAPVLIAFCDILATPAPELLAVCREVILVRRHGTHYRKNTPRPDTVEEFDSETFRAALKQTVSRWRPDIVQLEFTQMAQYAPACAPAKTILVEHDITFDLHQQLLAANPANWELNQQLAKWKAFETTAWSQVDAVVTMSPRDQATVTGAKHLACIPNGVDTTRFQPSLHEPEPRRLLFIGSFAHLPNVLAVEFFLNEVWPLLGPGYTLHIIAGMNLDQYPVRADLTRPGVELEGFVADVRPAYARAELVLAPLPASAGTNIKVLEAMAMGRVVVSTEAGVNGLAVTPGKDVLVTYSAAEMAQAIRTAQRHPMEEQARESSLACDWCQIANSQQSLYNRIIAEQ